MLARFQSSRTADPDALAAAFADAGFAPRRISSRARRAYSAEAVHKGRRVRVEGKWSAGRTTDVPCLQVTLQAPTFGGQFRCRRDQMADPKLRVPGAEALETDGAPRAGLQAALAGALGTQLAALAEASQDFSGMRAQDDEIELKLSGWPPTGRELTAAVELCATVADVLAAIAPGHEAEGAAFAEDEVARLRRSRRVALGLIAVAVAPAIGIGALMWPH